MGENKMTTNRQMEPVKDLWLGHAKDNRIPVICKSAIITNGKHQEPLIGKFDNYLLPRVLIDSLYYKNKRFNTIQVDYMAPFSVLAAMMGSSLPALVKSANVQEIAEELYGTFIEFCKNTKIEKNKSNWTILGSLTSLESIEALRVNNERNNFRISTNHVLTTLKPTESDMILLTSDGLLAVKRRPGYKNITELNGRPVSYLVDGVIERKDIIDSIDSPSGLRVGEEQRYNRQAYFKQSYKSK